MQGLHWWQRRDMIKTCTEPDRKLYVMADDTGVSAADALEALGMTIEELEEAEQKLYASGKLRLRSRDNRICVCGHRMSAHTSVAGTGFCRPTKMECPCKSPRPVLEVQDTRLFNYKTEGSGALHALARGILASVRGGRWVKWSIELVCDRCKKPAERLLPCAVSQRGRAMDEATGHDALLCEECRREI